MRGVLYRLLRLRVKQNHNMTKKLGMYAVRGVLYRWLRIRVKQRREGVERGSQYDEATRHASTGQLEAGHTKSFYTKCWLSGATSKSEVLCNHAQSRMLDTKEKVGKLCTSQSLLKSFP